jgi:hypothetical protein
VCGWFAKKDSGDNRFIGLSLRYSLEASTGDHGLLHFVQTEITKYILFVVAGMAIVARSGVIGFADVEAGHAQSQTRPEFEVDSRKLILLDA